MQTSEQLSFMDKETPNLHRHVTIPVYMWLWLGLLVKGLEFLLKTSRVPMCLNLLRIQSTLYTGCS